MPPQGAADVIEDDVGVGAGAGGGGEFVDLRVIEPGIEGEALATELADAVAEILRVRAGAAAGVVWGS